MENETLMKINKRLRDYDLMIIETGGRYDGQGILNECLELNNSYIDAGGCINDLTHMTDAIINEYEEMYRG